MSNLLVYKKREKNNKSSGNGDGYQVVNIAYFEKISEA
jgi:hypothetical protein